MEKKDWANSEQVGPGKAKVGAISKAQNCKRGPWGAVVGPVRNILSGTSRAAPNCQHEDFGSKYLQSLFPVPDRVRDLQRDLFLFLSLYILLRFYVGYVLLPEAPYDYKQFHAWNNMNPYHSMHGVIRFHEILCMETA